jgi:PmbA protein
VRASERSSLYYCYIFGMAREGESISSFDFQFDGARSAAAIDPEAVARKFADNVVSSLGAVKGESFRGPIILAPKAAAEILIDPITSSVSAASVQRETSRFRGKLGHVVASDILSVTDDSTLKDGAATTAFDREGLRPEVLPLIEGGVLRNFLYDAYTARKDNRPSNGHAGGGAAAVPQVSTTNVVVARGATSLSDMIAGIDRGVLATRFSGNADPVSGDFSGSVKGGRMIRGGKLAEPLCGTMIAGNTFELLKRITAVSSEHERMFGSVVPYIAIEEIAITGG